MFHPLVLALFIALLWGIVPVIYKYALCDADPLVVMVVSGIFGLVAVLLPWLFYNKQINNSLKVLKFKNYIWIGLAAILSVLGSYLYYALLKDHKSHVITGITYISPVFTLPIAYLILKEQVTLSSCSGIILIVLGVYLLSHGL
jgi:uncharacterized membrane protein